MLDKIIAALKAIGLIKDEDVAKATAELGKLELEKKVDPPAPLDTSKVTDPQVKALLDSLQTQNNSLTQMVKDLTTALAAEKTARDNAVAAQEAQNKTTAEKKVTDAVDAAIKGGKYPEAKRAWLKERFEKDFDGFTDVVKDAPVDKHFKPTGEVKKDDKGNVIPENNYRGPLSGADKTILKAIEAQQTN